MRGICLRLGCALILLAVAIRFAVPVRAGVDFPAGQQRSAAALFSVGMRDISVSWDDYWKLVEDTRQEIIELEQMPLDEARLRLEGIILQWDALTSLELPDGQVLALDPSYLVSLLEANPPDWLRLQHQLDTLLAEREDLHRGSFSDVDRNSLNHILAQPEFQWDEQNPRQPSALEKLWQRIQRELARLSTRLLGFKGSEYVIGFAALLLLAAGLLFLFRNLLFGFVAEARLAPPARTGDEALTADMALKRAQNLSHGGDYRSAVRYLYLSALLLLEERGLLSFDRTKTNREYLRSVADQPELEKTLQSVVEVFDRVWYGYLPLDDQTYQYYERQVGKLRQQRPNVQQRTDGG